MRTSISAGLFLVVVAGCPPAAAQSDAPGQAYEEVSLGLDVPTMESGRTELEMVDVNLDGHIDLIMVGDHGSPWVGTDQHGATVWFGDGTGVWTSVQSGDFGYGGLALGDVNGDGLVDLGFGVHHNYSDDDLGDQILEVALGDGTGTSWIAWDDGLATNGETWGMSASDFADVDGDGDLDVGSISFGCCAGVHVYLNHRNGMWTQSYGFLGDNSHQEFVFGEINGDGWPDFACSHSHGTVYLGDGRGEFVTADEGLPTTSTFDYLAGVSLGDVNGDGRDDLAFVNDEGGVEVFTREDGLWRDIGGGLPETGDWSATQLWDMDGDGVVDVAAFGAGVVRTWRGDGAGGWTELASLTTQDPGTYTAFRVGGDIDDNGYPDIAVISKSRTSPWSSQNIPQAFRELTAPSVLKVRIERPAPGARLRSGSAAFVRWAAEVPGGASAAVDIEYSIHGEGGPWHSTATDLPNNGRHQWIVPDVARAPDFRLRVTVRTPTDGSVSAVSRGPHGVAFGSGTVELFFEDDETMSWTDETAGRSAHNLYRGGWRAFLATGEYTQPPGGDAARWCGLGGSTQEDGYVPAAGDLVFYIAAGVTDGLEGSLDADSAGQERSNTHPCEKR